MLIRVTNWVDPRSTATHGPASMVAPEALFPGQEVTQSPTVTLEFPAKESRALRNEWRWSARFELNIGYTKIIYIIAIKLLFNLLN